MGRVQLSEITIEPEPEPPYRAIAVGVDVGQRRDYSAVVVVEAMLRDRGDGKGVETMFEIRDLVRLKLGTSYPQVADHLVEIVDRVAGTLADEGARGEPWVVVDSTGVGLPIVDLVRAALQGHHVMVTGVTITGGERFNGRLARWMNVPKMHLVSRLQVLLEQRRLKAPDTPMGRALGDELLNFEIRRLPEGALQTGAFSVGKHDDLVVATGLATLKDRAEPRGIEWI